MDFKVVMCGCTAMGIDVLNHLLSHNISITHIVSLNEKQSLDWNVSGYSSFENISKKHNIPIYFPKSYSLKEPEDVEFFENQKFDLLILVYSRFCTAYASTILHLLNKG